jgi:hypothetical protein
MVCEQGLDLRYFPVASYEPGELQRQVVRRMSAVEASGKLDHRSRVASDILRCCLLLGFPSAHAGIVAIRGPYVKEPALFSYAPNFLKPFVPNFGELRACDVPRMHHALTSGSVKLHSWVTVLGQQRTEAEPR